METNEGRKPLFINKYTVTKEDIREFIWAGSGYTALSVLSGVMLGACVISVLGGGSPLIFIPAGLVIAYLVFRYFASVKRAWERILEQAHGEPGERTVIFYEDGAEARAEKSGNVTTIDYSVIKKVVVTKRLIILATRARLGYDIHRGHFTLGTEKDFMAFISAKIALKSLK